MRQPVRLQLSRAKGFRLQEHSLAVNGLPAVKVDRTTMWGNPFVIGEDMPGLPGEPMDATDAVHCFVTFTLPTLDLTPLRGRNLACWCRDGKPCHALPLLEWANRPNPPDLPGER